MTTPDIRFQLDVHGKAKAPDAREEAFQAFLRGRTEYDQTVRDNGDTPWHHGDIDKRRELFMKRYLRPPAPDTCPPPESIGLTKSTKGRWPLPYRGVPQHV